MFEFLRKKVKCEIYSPVKGQSISLDQVQDQVFAKKMMGEGIAFFLEGNTVYAPCNGEIILVASTKHALGIKTENGAEILIHIGLDTVNLNGKGFEVLVKTHDRVQIHTPVIRINRTFMEEKNINLTVPMVVTNSQNFEIQLKDSSCVNLNTLVMEIKRK